MRQAENVFFFVVHRMPSSLFSTFLGFHLEQSFATRVIVAVVVVVALSLVRLSVAVRSDIHGERLLVEVN